MKPIILIFALTLFMLPAAARASCGADPAALKDQVTNIGFRVHGASFGQKLFEIHRTTSGFSFADPDGESFYFNGQGKPCLSAPSSNIEACGDELKQALGDNRLVLKSRNQPIGEIEIDYERNQIFIWSVDGQGRIEKSRSYVRVSNASSTNQVGLNVEAIDPSAGKIVGTMTAKRDFTRVRCPVVSDPDEYLLGRGHSVANLVGQSVTSLNGRVRSESFSPTSLAGTAAVAGK